MKPERPGSFSADHRRGFFHTQVESTAEEAVATEDLEVGPVGGYLFWPTESR